MNRSTSYVVFLLYSASTIYSSWFFTLLNFVLPNLLLSIPTYCCYFLHCFHTVPLAAVPRWISLKRNHTHKSCLILILMYFQCNKKKNQHALTFAFWLYVLITKGKTQQTKIRFLTSLHCEPITAGWLVNSILFSVDFSNASCYDIALCVTARPIRMQMGAASPALLSSPGCTVQFAFVTTQLLILEGEDNSVCSQPTSLSLQ